MTIRTVLVDDEPLATQGLQLRLEAHDDVEVVATAAKGREAIRAVKTHKPDPVLLDIQMPGLSGLELAQVLSRFKQPPRIVFVTAHEEHAVEAFDLAAVDYVLKPVRAERLAAAGDDPAGDDGEQGRAAGERPDERGDWVLGRRSARVVEGEGREVGLLARFERADLGIEVERAGAAQGGEVERLGGGEGVGAAEGGAQLTWFAWWRVENGGGTHSRRCA